MKHETNIIEIIEIIEAGRSELFRASSFSPGPSSLLPLPALPITVRPATTADLPFIDALQKKHSKAVGWMPTQQLEGKIAAQQMLIAANAANESLGYLIGQDRYFKRDDVGIIYAINIVPAAQRSLVAATLLKAQFERSAYGCRLYCCWCAQDLAANRFWEALGFVPIAFRTGSAKKSRVHIFWQKRIRAGDTGDLASGGTAWWFPSQTSSGSIREDRIVLPIPPGTHWSEAKPLVLPGMDGAPRRRSPQIGVPACATQKQGPSSLGGSALRFSPPKKSKRSKAEREKRVNDPRLIAAARELRDRWQETIARDPRLLESYAPSAQQRYDVSRQIVAGTVGAAQLDAEIIDATPIAALLSPGTSSSIAA